LTPRAIDDDLTVNERAELHASLDRALDDAEAGRGMGAAEYLKRYDHSMCRSTMLMASVESAGLPFST
jgi:hypothetical protein